MLKIALVCCGLEHIQRGFESFSRELFDHFQAPGMEMDLIKGSGKETEREIVIRSIRRDSALLRWIKPSPKGLYYRYKIECMNFGLSMLPLLFKRKYDLIHCSDNELGKVLLKFKKWFGLKYRIIFLNGAPWHAGECRIFDATQEVTKAMQQKNLQDGVEKARSWYLPHGIDVNNFRFEADDLAALKQQFGIPANAFVILSLSALKFSHKRIDWLIKEYKQLKGNYFLVMAGGEDEETPQVKRMAQEELQPGSYTIMTVPYNRVARLLAACDVMVATSLSEAFGLVLLEATAARTPVLAHPHYAAKEIIAHPSSFVNMEQPGALANAISTLSSNAAMQQEIIETNYKYCLSHFDWSSLNAQYAAMYQGVYEGNPAHES